MSGYYVVVFTFGGQKFMKAYETADEADARIERHMAKFPEAQGVERIWMEM